MASTPLHQRLQIEFQYTQFLQPLPEIPTAEMTAATTQNVDVTLAEAAT